LFLTRFKIIKVTDINFKTPAYETNFLLVKIFNTISINLDCRLGSQHIKERRYNGVCKTQKEHYFGANP
jgi:hypothetical protein